MRPPPLPGLCMVHKASHHHPGSTKPLSASMRGPCLSATVLSCLGPSCPRKQALTASSGDYMGISPICHPNSPGLSLMAGRHHHTSAGRPGSPTPTRTRTGLLLCGTKVPGSLQTQGQRRDHPLDLTGKHTLEDPVPEPVNS